MTTDPVAWVLIGLLVIGLLGSGFGMGWECSECGADTGLMYPPRPCPRGCGDEQEGG